MSHLFPMPRVYSYVRFSTPEQASGDSLRRQMEGARRYADSRGLELDESLSIRDLGVSAFKGGNVDQGLGRFLEAVRNGLVEAGSILAVESLDRLSRQVPRKASKLLEEIVDAGITVATLSDGQEYTAERLDSDPMALILALMVAWRAHEESATKGRRVGAAWAEKRRKVRAGEAERLTLRGPSWLIPDGGGWRVDEPKADVVRRMYALTLAGWGEHRIAEALNLERVPVLGRGKLWHRSTVAKMLRNRAVIGELVPGRITHADGKRRRELEEPIPGAFPAIISEEDWLAVRSMKDGHAPAVRGRGAGRELANVLAGLARCPICGDSMTRVSKGPGGGVPKLVCTRAKVGAGCAYHGVSLEAVERAVVDKADWLRTSVPAGDQTPELDRQVDALTSNIAGTEEHVRELAEALETAPSRKGAQALAKAEAELVTMRRELEAVEERRRLVDGGLVQERTHAMADAATALGTGEGSRGDVNARLRVLFEGVTVDYPRGELVFHWRQGGTSSLKYAYDWGS